MSAEVVHQVSQPSSSQQQPPPAAPRKPQRCAFRSSDNRRCTMLLHPSHPTLCLFHARNERLLLESERIGSQLKSISGEFRTTTDINHVLGKLWDLLADDRISRKRAATMAYVAALLLPTVERVRLESNRAVGFDEWTKALRRAYPPQRVLSAPSTGKK